MDWSQEILIGRLFHVKSRNLAPLLLLSRVQLCATPQPTRLPRPWDSPGKNTGVGCHFLLQCMKVKSESEVARLCRTIRDPMNCSLPGSSIHGILQARVLEWGAIAFSESCTSIFLKSFLTRFLLMLCFLSAFPGHIWS